MNLIMNLIMDENCLFQSHNSRPARELLNSALNMGSHPREPNSATSCARHLCEHLRVACIEAIAMELINVSELYSLNEQKVEELVCLLVFVWSRRSEKWPR